jgi:hypothetical protein
MNISDEEALSLLNSWFLEKTTLRACFSKPGATKEVHGLITDIAGTTIKVDTEPEEIEINLDGAEFNGDKRAPASAPHSAYLICEFRNDDRWTFYAPRPSDTDIPALPWGNL